MPATGYVLAGGRGERLGAGIAKAAVRVGGRPLLARAVETVLELPARCVVVAPAWVELPSPERTTRVHDPGEGPLAALVAAVAAEPAEHAVVLAADLPLVDARLLRSLEASRARAPAVAARVGGIVQPLAAWITAEGLAGIVRLHAAGERSLARALVAIGASLTDAACLPGGVDAFTDLDTPEDLEHLQRRLGGSAR